jgi:hypothetical protein
MTEREYKELVLADFDQKLADEQLPIELISPTRKSLKALSVDVCAQRFDPKDESMLRSFFGPKEDAAAYMKAIQKTSADHFKTLHNFLNNRNINTAFDNIRLLAWLIDFKPRPYSPNLPVPEPPVVKIRLSGKRPTDPNVGDIKTSPGVEPTRGNRKRIVIYVALVILITLAGYLVYDHQKQWPSGYEGCMVWTDDKYQPIDCTQKRGNLPIFKLDTQKVTDFKRVSTDTLSPRALGHVWYAKFSGQIEFYSDSGQHPVDTNKRLLPLTSHILNKYVFHVADPK